MKRERNIQILNDTLSRFEGFEYNTQVILKDRFKPSPWEGGVVTYREGKMQDALWSTKGKVAILNFASAHHPGGGTRTGAAAQEEDLCRCSDLLFHLEDPRSEPYYKDAKSLPAYHDRIMVHPSVRFIKDGSYTLREPREAVVITAPAPNRNRKGVTQDIARSALMRRSRMIVSAAAEQKVRTLILGAWGMGVFGNQKEDVKSAFQTAIYGCGGRIQEFVFCFIDENQVFKV